MNCILCKSSNTENVYSSSEEFMIKDIIQYDLNIELCNDCGFVYLASAYEEDYESLVEKVYSNFNKSNVLPFPYKSDENIFTRDMILEFLKDGSNILEIGSNRGDMLYLLKEKLPNINILGIEPTSNQEAKVPTIRGFFNEELFSNKFDFIYMQHVLEHIPSPQNIVKSLHSLLKDDGYLYIEVPSLEYSLDNNVEDFMLEHVSYFSKDTLLTLFSKFELLKIEEKPFLRTVFKKSKKESTYNISSEAYKQRFLSFKEQKQNILDEISNIDTKIHKRVVFFGVSFYFRKLFKEISPLINECESLFMDDNFKDDIEPTYNLKRVERIENNDIIVLCSNNYDVQIRMLNIIKNKCDNKLICIQPWKGITRI